MTRTRRSFLLGPLGLFVLLAAIGAAWVAVAPWFDLEQELGLAWLYPARGPVAAPKDVVVISLNLDTARRLGLPDRPAEWPRSLHAELVRDLTAAGARVIVFDISFEKPSARPEDDVAFGAAIRDSGRVLVTESLRREAIAVSELAKNAPSVIVDRRGQLVPEIDGAVRGRAPFVVPKAARVDSYWAVRPGGWDIPSLPLLAWRVFNARQDAPPGSLGAAASAAGSGAPGDPAETGLLNLYGPPQTITTVPLHAVIAAMREGRDAGGSGEAPAFRDKAVFVGFSATSPEEQDRLRDDYRTVFSRSDGLNTSGVELAATAFANLLEGRALHEVAPGVRLAVVIAWAALLATVCIRLRPALALLVSALAAAFYLAYAYRQFSVDAVLWPTIVPVAVQMPIAFLVGVWLHYVVTHRERLAVQRALGYYVPKPLAEQFAHDADALSTSRVVYGSCLATDVSQYVSIAEHLDPAQLGRLLNDYFAQLFVPVERSGGTVMDVVGDAMIAVWSAPEADVDVRRRACTAALTIVAAVDRFNARAPGAPMLPTRFGLHSGPLLMGNVGASTHYEYRAMGDTVNTASRLEALNKKLGTRLLASAATLESLDEFARRRLGIFLLAGKDASIEIFELLDAGRAEPALSDAHARFAEALAHYESARFDVAMRAFEALLVDRPEDGPTRFYLERCRSLLQSDAAQREEPTPIRA